MKALKLVIDQDGFASGIYDDDCADLYDALGAVEITRASFVEPCAVTGLGWRATMPCGCQPRCGAVVVLGPYRLRSEALAAEVEYLDRVFFGTAAATNKRGV